MRMCCEVTPRSRWMRLGEAVAALREPVCVDALAAMQPRERPPLFLAAYDRRGGKRTSREDRVQEPKLAARSLVPAASTGSPIPAVVPLKIRHALVTATRDTMTIRMCHLGTRASFGS